MSPKLIKKLADKKYRTETGLFLVEGAKNIHELLTSPFVVEEIYGTSEFLDKCNEAIRAYEKRTMHSIKIVCVNEEELSKIGTLMTNNAGIAIVQQERMPSISTLSAAAKNGFLLALDDVRDPGNLGTIIRIADWYGITHIVASEMTTDSYNPKTIAASMGSFTRVAVTYCDLAQFLKEMKESGIPIMGADLDGTNIHDGALPPNGILLMGSESHGISDTLSHCITQKVTIPKFGHAESLNVSVATGILLDALRRT